MGFACGHWRTIETQTNAWVQQSAEQLIHSLNHSADATTTPFVGGTKVFIPGAILGFMKG
jgi:hypothetical protein